jgi:hypothetical protein
MSISGRSVIQTDPTARHIPADRNFPAVTSHEHPLHLLMRAVPTPDDLERLYRAALALHKARLRQPGGEERFHAVEDPESGVVGFVIAGGAVLYGDPGAIVFFDAEGLRVHTAIESAADPGLTDLGLRRHQLAVGYDFFEHLPEDERALVSALDLDAPEGAVPYFMLHLPAMMTMPPDAASARFAAVALVQAIASPAARDDARSESGEIPVRVLRDGVWREEWRSRDEVLDVDYGTPPPVREEWASLAKSVKRRTAQWELGAMLLPTQHAPGRPELDCLHMIVDGTEVIASINEPHRDAVGLCELLASTIAHHKVRPKSLLVADPVLGNAVSELARALSIELQLVDHLPTVGPIYGQIIADAFGDDDEEFTVVDDEDLVDGYDDTVGSDEAAYELPTGTQVIEMPEGFRVRRLTVDYDLGAGEETDAGEEKMIAELFERMVEDPAAGIDELRALIERYPANETLRIALMSTLASIGRDAESRAAAAAARAAFPGSFELRVAHANLLVELGDASEALAALDGARELADLYPDRTEFKAGDLLLFHTSLYRIHAVLDRFDDATRDLEALNRILPGHPDFAVAAETHARSKPSSGNGTEHP